MALIIVSLLVLVPLALLGWDLARTSKNAARRTADTAAPAAPSTTMAMHGQPS
jgi:hypothetical protein